MSPSKRSGLISGSIILTLPVPKLYLSLQSKGKILSELSPIGFAHPKVTARHKRAMEVVRNIFKSELNAVCQSQSTFYTTRFKSQMLH